MKPVFRLAAAFALAPLALTVASAPSPALAQDTYWDPKIVVGSEPYALNGSTLDGKKLDLADYKGKVLVIDFWATWCGPCVAEIPKVKETYSKYHGEGLEILGVSLDRDKTKLTDYIKAKEMPWAQVYDRDLEKEGNANHYGV
ncbi:TlpA family protein disulfide reductase, partial [bacterium]